jgi:hypothetical protein
MSLDAPPFPLHGGSLFAIRLHKHAGSRGILMAIRRASSFVSTFA